MRFVSVVYFGFTGVVFNVSRYLNFHPGGVPELMKGVGKDGTKLFDDVSWIHDFRNKNFFIDEITAVIRKYLQIHPWVNYQSILKKCIVGRLERSINADLYFESDKDKSGKWIRKKKYG